MTRLSNRQYPMLGMFATESAGFYMSIGTARQFDQRAFRSMLIQEWIAYKPSRGFHITRKGREAWHEFQETDITRMNPKLPLTAYFDVTAYGLAPSRKGNNVYQMRRRSAAA